MAAIGRTPGSAGSIIARLAVPGWAVVAVLARLPFVSHAPGPDEAGFLLVGHQWQAGGTSLYGNYWVDRPPLLVTLFKIAADLGGVVPLRLIGCLATVIVVLGSAHIARRLAGPRAAAWTAAIAAALCISPLLGGLEVNGELLAAPFVVVGLSAVLRGIDEPREDHAVLAACFAGAATVAALLVKQNMADVGIFAAVTGLVAWRRGEVSGSRLRRTAAAYAVGAVVALGLAAAWTLMHGTSLTGVFDAMYPFRIDAGRLMASSGHHQHATARLWALLASWLVSGAGVVTAVVAWALVSRRLRGSAVWGLLATLAFDAVSVALGGNYWHHYLVELVVPTAVLSGMLVARRQPLIRTVLMSSLVVAVFSWSGSLPSAVTSTPASSEGRAIADVARSGDTIVTALGHADVTGASGLSSPYPYLWSLPALTLDPRLTTLDHVLSGAAAPTWFVRVSNLRLLGTAGAATQQVLEARYHRVADLHGATVYLRDGVHRAIPHLPGSVANQVTSGAPRAPTKEEP